MAHDMGIALEEAVIMPEELLQADEVFLTGTAAEIAPVGKIDEQEYEIGPVTTAFKESYADLVRQKPLSAKTG
jgi:branched-chain amino acid aminotransferase